MGSRKLSARQAGLIERRVNFVSAEILLLRKSNVKFESITGLAKYLAGKVSASERTDGNSVSFSYSTLLRVKGCYYSILKEYFEASNCRSDTRGGTVVDPFAARVIAAKDLEVASLQNRISKLEAKLVEKASREIPVIYPHQESVLGREMVKYSKPLDCYRMGVIANMFFEKLLETEQFKFDENSGDILNVGRARVVAISRLDISDFLRWKSDYSK